MTKFFDAKITCRLHGSIGAVEPVTIFMIRHDDTEPSVERVVKAATDLGYEHIMVREIIETVDPAMKGLI